MMNDAALTSLIRDVPDFPKAGIVFKDITPLLADPAGFQRSVEQMLAPFKDRRITKIAAVESRGFIFGAAMARAMGCGFVPIRKPGKLPWATRRHEYTLEYGSGVLEIHDDAVSDQDHVLLVDDVLATGGTAEASVALVRHFGARIEGCSFLIELGFLNGRQRLADVEIHSAIVY